jgi:hypothetical protein
VSGIPLKPRGWAWAKEPWLTSALASFCSFALSILKLEHDKSGATFYFLTCIAYLAVACQSFFQWRNRKTEVQCHELAGCLYTLHSVLTVDAGEGEGAHNLRITIHRALDDGEKLVQILDYVGDGRGGPTAGREFLANCGSIGQALRTKEAVLGKRTEIDYEKYVDELVRIWHYTEVQARKMNHQTMSWSSVPLALEGNGSRIEAVLYLDSTNPDFFTEERLNAILAASVGIARFVKKRYY